MNTEDYNGEDALKEDLSLYESEDFDLDDDDEDEEDFEFGDLDDDEVEFDNDDDDESEEAEFLGPLIGAVAPPLIGTAIKGIGSLIRPRPRKPRKFRRFTPIVGRGGIRGGTIRTPRGVARIRLPRSVVTVATHRRDVSRLNRRDNQLNARINRTQKDLARTEKKASQALALAGTANTRVVRLRRKHKRDLKRLKEDQSSAATLNMMVSMMQLQSLNDTLAKHTHDDSGAVENPPIQNQAMMFLPMLLADSDGGDDTMLMVMLMMAMNSQKSTSG